MTPLQNGLDYILLQTSKTTQFSHPIGFFFFTLAEYLEKLLGAPVDILTPARIEEIRVPQVAKENSKERGLCLSNKYRSLYRGRLKLRAVPCNTLLHYNSCEDIMNLHELKNIREQLYQVAARYGISKVYVFGSVARGESSDVSDLDLLIEMESDASAFGVGAFQFEVQKLLGIPVDVVPTFTLPKIEDKLFVQSVQADAVAL